MGSPARGRQRSTGGRVSTAESLAYTPSRAEARLIAAAKNADVILDRGDMAALIRAVATVEDCRLRAERNLTMMAHELAGLKDLLEIARLQLAQ